MIERCATCEFRGSNIGANPCPCKARYPHKEPPAECSREEIVKWCVENGLDMDESEWLLAWANRRYAQLLEVVEDGISAIASEAGRRDSTMTDAERIDSLAQIAWSVLRRLGLPNERIRELTGATLPKIGSMGFGHD